MNDFPKNPVPPIKRSDFMPNNYQRSQLPSGQKKFGDFYFFFVNFKFKKLIHAFEAFPIGIGDIQKTI